MNVFRRLFKIGQAEAHNTIDKMEDPIKMTEQGIRDLKEDLGKSLESLAKVKAMTIRASNELKEFGEKATDYEKKAMLLLQKAQAGDVEVAEAERLAKEALLRKEEQIKLAATAKDNHAHFAKSESELEANIKQLKANITKWENELKTLKARVNVSNATKNLNKQLADIDSSSTVSLLERMKDKVAEQEALAEAYGEMANDAKSIDDEIDSLADDTDWNAQNELDKMKEKLGLS